MGPFLVSFDGFWTGEARESLRNPSVFKRLDHGAPVMQIWRAGISKPSLAPWMVDRCLQHRHAVCILTIAADSANGELMSHLGFGVLRFQIKAPTHRPKKLFNHFLVDI